MKWLRIIEIVWLSAILLIGCGGYYEDDYYDDGYYEDDYYDDGYYEDDDYNDGYEDEYSGDGWLDDGYYELPEDCWPDEVYDEEDRLCYLAVDCEDGVCEEFGVDPIGEFFSLVEELLWPMDAEREAIDSEGEEVLVTYQIQGNRIGNPVNAAVSGDLVAYQQDTQAHQQIWGYFADMFPPENRTYLTEFVIFTDGEDEGLAAVEQDRDDMRAWVLAVDIADADDPTDLTYTLVHEYGHLLTLNPAQVEPNSAVFYEPDNEQRYEDAAASCPTYFPGEGCSLSNSYINAFFDRFWREVYPIWDDINYIEDDDAYYEALDDFYYEYEDWFVTDYAATNPEEDIAESWAHFILEPKPDGNTVAEQKVLFFYEWPELVALRAEIVSRTYSRLRRQ